MTTLSHGIYFSVSHSLFHFILGILEDSGELLIVWEGFVIF